MAKSEEKKQKEIEQDILETLAQPDTEPERESPTSDVPGDVLSDAEVEEVASEIALERKYGDKSGEAAALSALSGATFGVSDQIARKIGISEERLREVRNRSPIASGVGEVTGIVVPTLFTGGTSAAVSGAVKGAQAASLATKAARAAKGVAGVAGSGTRAATAASRIAEKATAKALQGAIKQTGKESLAKRVLAKGIEKATGGAVEGALYESGRLVSEDALGTAEFNAENLMARAGLGGVVGAGFAGTLGAGMAIMPVVSKATGKVTDYAVKKLKGSADPDRAALELAGYTPSKITKIFETDPLKAKNMGSVVKRKNLISNLRTSSEEFLENIKTTASKVGKEIGDDINKLDELQATYGAVLPARQKVGDTILLKLDDLQAQFSKLDDAASQSAARTVGKTKRNITQKYLSGKAKDTPITAKELQQLKSDYYDAINFDRGLTSVPINEEIRRRVASGLKQTIDDAALAASKYDDALATRLKQNNLDYGTLRSLEKNLPKKIDKDDAADFLNFKDVILGGASLGVLEPGMAGAAFAMRKFANSDLKKRLILLTDIESANVKVSNAISKAAKSIVKGSRAARPAAQRMIMKTQFDYRPEQRRQKPKSDREAWNRITKNLNDLSGNAELLTDRIALNTYKLSQVAPGTAEKIQQRAVTALQFLHSKLPLSMRPATIFDEFEAKQLPSKFALSKFERYMRAVENPLEVIEDIGNGSISREGVEALKAVYPDMFARVQSQIMDQVSQNADKMQYRQKLTLGVVFDVPSHVSLTQEMLAALQSQYVPSEEQVSSDTGAQRGAVKPSRKGMEALNFADKAETEHRGALEGED